MVVHGRGWGWIGYFGVLVVLLLAACSPYRAQQVIHFPDGSLRWAVDLEGGQFHGEMTYWHANGHIAEHGYYLHGEKHGLFSTYDDEETLIQHTVFEHGELVWSGAPEATVPLKFSHLVVAVASKEAIAPPKPRAATFTTTAPDPMEPVVLFQTGYHAQERTTLSTDLKLVYRSDNWIALATMSRASVDDDLGPSGSKTSASLGGGYTLYDADGYSLSVTSKLSLPIAGDDIGGFAATSRSIHHQLSESANAEPHSAWLQTLASLRRVKGKQTLRIDMGLTPAWSVSGELPAPTDNRQLMAYVGVAVGLAMRGYSFSAEFSSSSKVIGALEDTHTSLAAGFSVHFDTKLVQPSVSLISPIDSETGESFVILLGLRHSLKGNEHD